MKKLLVLLIVTLVMFTLSGCEEVTLEKAMLNSADINSFAYDINIERDIKPEVDSEGNELTIALQNKVRLEGKAKKQENGEVLNYMNILLSSDGLDMEIPIHSKINEKDESFEIFIGIPESYNELLGTDYSTAYISSEELKELTEVTEIPEDDSLEVNSIEVIETPEDDEPENNKQEKLAKDIMKIFLDYIKENDIQQFEQLDDKSKKTNGVYTIKLTKDDLKNMALTLVSNEEYYNDLKEVADTSYSYYDGDELVSFFPTQEELKESINEGFEEISKFDITTKFTIEDEYITRFNILLEMSILGEEISTISFDVKISDINEDLLIKYINFPLNKLHR